MTACLRPVSDSGSLPCVPASLAGPVIRLPRLSVPMTACLRPVSDSGSLPCVPASLAGPVIRLPQLTYGGSANVTATAGQTARLPCNIHDLGDRAVSQTPTWETGR